MEKETYALGFPIDKRYAIIGLEKNIGKTTVLNWISRIWAKNAQTTFLLSIGRDGEEVDVLDARPKPRVDLPKGNYALSGERVLTTPALLEVIEVFPFETAAGRPIVFKAMEDTTIELINPGGLKNLTEITDRFLGERVCDRVLVDGAFNRLSHAQWTVADYVLLVTGAEAQGTFEEILERTVYLVERLEKLSCAPEWRKRIEETIQHDSRLILFPKGGKPVAVAETLLQNPKMITQMENAEAVYLEGALTQGVAEKLLQEKIETDLIVRDGPCIQVDYGLFRRMQARGLRLSVLYPIPVVGIFVNSFGARRSFINDRMRQELKRRLPSHPVLDLFEGTEIAKK